MGIVRPVMEHYPWAWLFFVPFIIITSFAVLNLFIGIIVDAMQTSHADDERTSVEDHPPPTTTTPTTELFDQHEMQLRVNDLLKSVKELETMVGSSQRK